MTYAAHAIPSARLQSFSPDFSICFEAAETSDGLLREFGQVHTPRELARHMAATLLAGIAMIDRDLVALDPGAGQGMLTIALVEAACMRGVHSLHVVLYEFEPATTRRLAQNMRRLEQLAAASALRFTYDIISKDFLLGRLDRSGRKFDLVLLNPPYLKLRSDTPQAGATSDLFSGSTNSYSAFVAISLAALKPNGRLLGLIPRSFASGSYFRGFRQYLRNEASIDTIHLFDSRSDVFAPQKVLQEVLLIGLSRSSQRRMVEITQSESSARPLTSRHMISANHVLQGNDGGDVLRFPASVEAAQSMLDLDRSHASFATEGYEVSTGRVIPFRAERHILPRQASRGCSIPLYRLHNIRNGVVEWTGQHPKDVRFSLSGDIARLTCPAQPCVLLRRFSAKEDATRLSAGILMPEQNAFGILAIENHVNIITHHDGPMSREELRGLATYLNSTRLDQYFRAISGSTQVNASDVRILPMPRRGELIAMA